jgi:hypothetical protein
MIGDDGVIGEAGGYERGTRQVDPIDPRQPAALHVRRSRFEILGARVEQARDQNESKIDEGRDKQDGKGRMIAAVTR